MVEAGRSGLGALGKGDNEAGPRSETEGPGESMRRRFCSVIGEEAAWAAKAEIQAR